jgi:hypothetical protein
MLHAWRRRNKYQFDSLWLTWPWYHDPLELNMITITPLIQFGIGHHCVIILCAIWIILLKFELQQNKSFYVVFGSIFYFHLICFDEFFFFLFENSFLCCQLDLIYYSSYCFWPILAKGAKNHIFISNLKIFLSLCYSWRELST